MSLINSTAIPSGATAYEIDQSLRFNDDDTAYLNLTPSSAGNVDTWTFSAWVKVGNTVAGAQGIFYASSGLDTNSNATAIYFNDGGLLKIRQVTSSSQVLAVTSNAFLRDPSAWYHIVVACDTTQGTDTNRIKLYVNGELLSLSQAVYPSQNLDTYINSTNIHVIGKYPSGSNYRWDGYIAETNLIDGTALTPSSFGETGDYGEWKPKAYSGSYGTNGFYLPFKQDYTVEGMSTVLYKGNNVDGHYIGGTGFSPDLTWIKARDQTYSPNFYDTVRGTSGGYLATDGTGAEAITHGKIASQTDGFTTLTGSSTALNVNGDGAHYVAWNWDMGGSNATNTAGSIQSTVRANPTYGQSIVSYVGNGSGSQNVGHGLSSAPEMVFVKSRDSSGSGFLVRTTAIDGSSDFLELNLTNAKSDSGVAVPSSTVVNLGTSVADNTNTQNYIAYCFHSVTGYSKVGSYTGNGGSNAITTGFKPAFVMMKSTSATGSWGMFDNTRTPYNPIDKALFANLSIAEFSLANMITFTNTGFTINISRDFMNIDGTSYIYMAFADKREYAYWLDQSGNNNDWTSNNLTESDVMVDSPTNNFATLNPLTTGSYITLSEGNLKALGNSAADGGNTRSTMGMSTGLHYAEVYIGSNTYEGPGVSQIAYSDRPNNGNPQVGQSPSPGSVAYKANGTKIINGSGTTYGNSYANGDIVGIALDATNGAVYFSKNGVWQNSGNPTSGSSKTGAAITWTAPIEYVFAFAEYNGSNCTVNFGQDSSFAGAKTAQGNQDGNDIGDFYYTPPTGFLALCTSNLPDVAVIPSEHMNTVLYTGTGSSNAITGVGFNPDLTWIKGRNNADSHNIEDVIRGKQRLFSNTTGAESAGGVESRGADGFTVDGGQDTNNAENHTYVAWNWKANGSGSSNTNGSINSTVSANVDAGFSIVNWTKEGSSGTKTVGHGLSKAPEIIIFKEVDNTSHWSTYTGVTGSTTRGLLYLDLTAAQTTNDANQWSDTAPTSTVFTYNQSYSFGNNNDKEMIGYAFHSVDGYSKVGSYTGNGSTDGTFIYTGFRPTYFLCKNVTQSEGWEVWDGVREPNNLMTKKLSPNTSTEEWTTSTTHYAIDFLSNGVKLRTTYSAVNNNAQTFIYLAFAEQPFKYSNAR